jgi:hypothetical protein
MSTVRLRRMWQEYRNSRYSTISGIFPLRNEFRISACARLMFSSCTARKWLSPKCRFVNMLSLNFLWKTETRQQSSTSDFAVYMEMTAWVGVRMSEGGWNILRTETRDIADQPHCGGCVLFDFLEKRGNNQCSSLRSDAQQTSSRASWKTSEEENCHPSTWQREALHCTSDLADNSKERLGTALPSTPQSGFGPPSDYHLFGPLKDYLRGHHYETDEAVQEVVRSWLRGAGTDIYRRGIFKILQRWQKCIDRDGYFVEK